jgi:hypothetical protein
LDCPWASGHPLWSGRVLPCEDLPLHVTAWVVQFGRRLVSPGDKHPEMLAPQSNQKTIRHVVPRAG